MIRTASRALARLGLAAAALVALACDGGAQPPRRSQLGTVSQQVALTHIEIVYRRPVARGRALFGTLVPYGRIWTPSADSAAVFTTSTPIEVAGQRLDAGSYSLWAIPGAEEWTLIFNREARAFHLAYPEGRDALRVTAKPREGEHMETLAFYFPVVDADSATMAMHWGKTVVAVPVRAVGARE